MKKRRIFAASLAAVLATSTCVVATAQAAASATTYSPEAITSIVKFSKNAEGVYVADLPDAELRKIAESTNPSGATDRWIGFSLPSIGEGVEYKSLMAYVGSTTLETLKAKFDAITNKSTVDPGQDQFWGRFKNDYLDTAKQHDMYLVYGIQVGEQYFVLSYDGRTDRTVTADTTVKNGTVTVSSTTAKKGDEVTVTATPAADYELDAITVMKGEDKVEVTDGKFTMPAGNVTVSATFKAKEYAITKGTTENGTLTVSAEKAAAGETVTITPTASEGYKVDKVTVKGAGDTNVEVTAGENGTYTFVMPSGGATVTATFTEVAASTEDKTIDAEVTVKPGETATVTTEAGEVAIKTDKDDAAISNAVLNVEEAATDAVAEKSITETIGEDAPAAVKEAADEVIAAIKDNTAVSIDISFTKDGKTVQPDKEVTITLPVPTTLKTATQLYLYHVSDKGIIEVASTFDAAKGTLTFTGKDFSPYIISTKKLTKATPAAGDNTPGTTTPGTTDGDNKGDNGDDNKNTGIALAVAPVVLAGACAVVLAKKKR